MNYKCVLQEKIIWICLKNRSTVLFLYNEVDLFFQTYPFTWLRFFKGALQLDRFIFCRDCFWGLEFIMWLANNFISSKSLHIRVRQRNGKSGLPKEDNGYAISKILNDDHCKRNTPFWAMLLLFTMQRGWYVFYLFFMIDVCSTISFKWSRRELSIDVAKHRSILKNNPNTHYLRFSFIP